STISDTTCSYTHSLHDALSIFMSNPTSEYFEKVYEDSIKLWLYVKDRQTNYQKWCQEMVATLWNMPYFEKIPRVSKDKACTIMRSEEHTSELQSRFDIVCRTLL